MNAAGGKHLEKKPDLLPSVSRGSGPLHDVATHAFLLRTLVKNRWQLEGPT